MLRKRLADTFMHYLTAYQTVQLYRESSLPKMEEAYKVQQDMYKARRLPWIEVVATQKELLALRAEYTAALRDLREAEVAIRGLLLVDGLTEPAPPLPGGHIDSVPKPR
jgi:cobalt-zinc-cadmium efflux system outer membrane protein